MNYLTKDEQGTKISRNNTFIIKSNSLKYVINQMCIKNISTFEGRKKAISIIFKIKTLIPIYINNEIFLFPTSSLRAYDVYYINYEEILSIRKVENYTELLFKDLTILRLKSSYYMISKQMERVNSIKKYLQYERIA